MSDLIKFAGFGLVTGSLLSLSAVGLTMQMGITHMINIAYVAVMTVAAFVAYQLHTDGLNIWLCIPVGGIVGAVMSLGMNRGVYMPYMRRGAQQFEMVMVALAILLIVESIIQAATRAGTYIFLLPPGNSIQIGSLQLTVAQVGLMGLAVVAMLGLHVLLTRTRLGKAMRATAADAALARSCGIATSRTVDLAWLVSGFFCGLGGVTYIVSSGTLTATSGLDFFLTVTAAVLLGGVGSPYGAVVASVVLGVASEVAAGYGGAAYKSIVAFGVLVLVILVRPGGFADASAFAEGEGSA